MNSQHGILDVHFFDVRESMIHGGLHRGGGGTDRESGGVGYAE